MFLWIIGDVLKKAGKKNAYIPRVLMMVLTTVLIGVIVAIMLVVGQIQGTATGGQLCGPGPRRDTAHRQAGKRRSAAGRHDR